MGTVLLILGAVLFLKRRRVGEPPPVVYPWHKCEV